MSSSDYEDALEYPDPLQPGSTGTPNNAPSTPSPEQQPVPSTAQTDFATSGYRRQAPRARRNLRGELDQRDDNLLRLDAQGRIVDSRGQLVRVVPSGAVATTASTPPTTVEALDPLTPLFRHVVVPVAKATFRHAVVPAAKAAVNMAANALSPPGAPSVRAAGRHRRRRRLRRDRAMENSRE